jgi:tripartite-type tricarboxylate transporter receptor subunit TctC
MMGRCAYLLIFAWAVSCAPSAQAEFGLSGKTVTFVIGGGAGGGVDAFARTLAPYLTKHLPGSPAVKITNMGASGGIQGVQYLASVAPHDGTYIGTTNAGPIAEPMMGQVKVTYHVGDFRWIGSLTRGDTVCAMWRDSKIKTIEDARGREVPMASTGATSAPTRATLLTAHILGLKFKPIPGYDGGTALLALERGEVEGTCTTLGSLRTTRPEWVRNGQLRLLVQVSMTKDPDFPNVPRLADLLHDETQRSMLEFLQAPYEFNNPLMLPPGAPDEALLVWREAFQRAVTDKAYLAEAEIRLQNIAPRNGSEVEVLVRRMLETPPDIIERLKQVTDIGLVRQ